ncbi:hypothetical protein [Deinococcus sp. QL22]|uniref:hypothetical protein n=1 Tax=Deinococcus sp. QL22 TaxID=2939437 RepID=UPI002017A97E|nr:hypothetical protein [Deinococcus sp. QL22]UQN10143.1 hypothetical protein M1R55_28565 [Deinococcus sp. QL22]
MTAAAWQMWVAGLPADPVELAQVRAGVQVEVEQAERRLAGVLATGGDSRAHRETLIELAKLNSKLRLLEARLEAGGARGRAQTGLSLPITSRS